MVELLAVHRRLAELAFKARSKGGYGKLNDLEQQDLEHCLYVSAVAIVQLDQLNQLSEFAGQLNDHDWQHSICADIEKLESAFNRYINNGR